jgi:hypothetical protein
MIKKLIIGSGFSASILNKVIGNKAKVFSIKRSNNLNKKNFIRRKNLDCNKFLGKKSISFGSTKFILNKSKFHDRLIMGGNSNIWGGHINLKKLSKKLLGLIEKNRILIQKLSYSITGTISSSKHIAQLQNTSGEIFKSEDLLDNIENAFILKLQFIKKKIFVEVLFLDSLKKKKIEVKKLFLCLGTIQLIDLLFRSNLLNENDEIELTEFDHKFALSLKNSKFIQNAITIRYSLNRAIGHFLGLQIFSKFFKFFNFIPISIDQIFYYSKSKVQLILKGNVFFEKNNTNLVKFGESIHYCNMKINKVPINEFLSKINKNLIGFGMPFVNQKIPGPISNDILLDIEKKIS